jgi:hypothetical protein
LYINWVNCCSCCAKSDKEEQIAKNINIFFISNILLDVWLNY